MRERGASSRLVLLIEGVLVACVLSAAVRTALGDGPSKGTLLGNLVGMSMFALPSLVVVAVTRAWRIWAFECGLSAPWLLIGFAGDFSGVDGAFVFLMPLSLAIPQVGLLLLALVTPSLRRPLEPRDGPSSDA